MSLFAMLEVSRYKLVWTLIMQGKFEGGMDFG